MSYRFDESLALLLRFLPERDEHGNKGTFGTLLAICGSVPYRGAAVLAVSAALRCGVGIVRLAAPECVISACAAQVPECTYLPLPDCPDYQPLPEESLEQLKEAVKRSTAVLVGCGLGDCVRTRSIVDAVASTENVPVLLDADALNCMRGDYSPLEMLGDRAVITPHVGEFSRLTGKPISEIKGNYTKLASEFSRQYGCTVVLKDYVTHIATPDGTVLQNTAEPNSGLAKGGSGDVLAGIISAFLAQGAMPKIAAAVGCAFHSEAGKRCAEKLSKYAMLPSDVIKELPEVFAAGGR